MGSPSELSLDYKPPCKGEERFSKPSGANERFFKAVLEVGGNGVDRVVRIEELVACLEEERRKIDVFKRELPLCMLLLNDAIDDLKEQARQCRLRGPVLEEFIPIKKAQEERENEAKAERDCKDKMNWMSSAQLWSDNSDNSEEKKEKLDEYEAPSEELQKTDFGEKAYTIGRYRNSGGAFVPLNGNGNGNGLVRKEENDIVDLSLSNGGIKELGHVSPKGSCRGNAGSSQSALQRKARRCWSPELHRRFVNALQQLGGSQVATPKQIRELMKVDGLTNDEVKSHLQKYRLHTRRPNVSVSSANSNQQNPPLVLLSNLWVPHDKLYNQTSSTASGSSSQSFQLVKKTASSQSGSPQGPFQYPGKARTSVNGGDSGGEEDGLSDEETN
ncbi:myb family transcription factor EFM [Amborella trichopoda]|uniref:HTH myb-type domain-containing protein n=1 Tax=Amborella trichopoda TaxID=13333 RepID=U5CWT6_AMBTC|nr:myb family transcription factor EFM [Amborella trichopoda]ERN14420.1 hypothetical protein AMTR_s00033p00241280 [Amborella trichopoda]|eukprot:XP_006852953.1 myb family transcription factor EFM [Amborella trichopoda]